MGNEIDIKRLKRLADACRKAGIRHFKAEGIEFTLSDYVPEKATRKRKGASPQATDSNPFANDFTADALTEEQLLAWNESTTP